MVLNRRKVLLSATVGAAGAVMTNTVSAKERNLDPDMDAIIARMMNVTKRGTTLATNQKYFVLLATCAAQGLSEEAEDVTAAALKAGVEPIAIKEAGVRLPLASQTTVNDQNRLAKGIEVQTAIFGDAITQMHKNTTEPMKPLMINDLSGYCFGDFYTRTGMSVKARELVVFAAIAALGGCEAQLKAHADANLKEGATKQNLIDALQVAVPLNGFPRTLNAVTVVNSIA